VILRQCERAQSAPPAYTEPKLVTTLRRAPLARCLQALQEFSRRALCYLFEQDFFPQCSKYPAAAMQSRRKLEPARKRGGGSQACGNSTRCRTWRDMGVRNEQ
jgi:hypothetical protein